MKTSKEMQLKIIDKMKDNVVNGECAFEGIQQNGDYGWLSFRTLKDMMDVEYRIKPETITINGVEIPKPLSELDIKNSSTDDVFYVPSYNSSLFISFSRMYILRGGDILVYATKEEAIAARLAAEPNHFGVFIRK